METVVDLAERKAGAIEVVLVWHRDTNALVVFAHDGQTGEERVIPVTADEALDVFDHPFGYPAERCRDGEDFEERWPEIGPSSSA